MRCEMRPILITSEASRSGKDFTAQTLCKYFYLHSTATAGVTVHAAHFKIADLVKRVVREVFGAVMPIKTEAAYDIFPHLRKVPLDSSGKSVVDLWISSGEWIRSIHPDALVSKVREGILHRGEKYPAVSSSLADGTVNRPNLYVPIVTDVRFENEWQALTAGPFNKAVVVRVVRTDGKSEIRGMDSFGAGIPADYVLENDGTSKYLAVVADFARKFLGMEDQNG